MLRTGGQGYVFFHMRYGRLYGMSETRKNDLRRSPTKSMRRRKIKCAWTPLGLYIDEYGYMDTILFATSRAVVTFRIS